MHTDERYLEKKEIEQLSEILSKRKKDASTIGILGIIASIIGFGIAIVYLFSLSKKQVEAVDDLKKNKVIIDSLENTKKAFDLEKKNRDSISLFVNDFLTTIKSDSTLTKYYSNFLERYYLLENISLKEVIKERTKNRQRHPRSKLTFNKEDILLKNNPDTNYEAFINTSYYPDSTKLYSIEIVYQLKINKNKKVYFIRNLEPQIKK